jgi:hypothetical protein
MDGFGMIEVGHAIPAEPGWHAAFYWFPWPGDEAGEPAMIDRWPVVAWRVNPIAADADYDAIAIGWAERTVELQDVSCMGSANVIFLGFFHPERFPEPGDLTERAEQLRREAEAGIRRTDQIRADANAAEFPDPRRTPPDLRPIQ